MRGRWGIIGIFLVGILWATPARAERDVNTERAGRVGANLGMLAGIAGSVQIFGTEAPVLTATMAIPSMIALGFSGRYLAAGFGSLVDSIQTGDWLRTPRRLGTSLGILAGGAMAAHYGAHLEVTPLVKGLGLLSGIALGGAAGTATGATIGLARKLCGWGALTPK